MADIFLSYASEDRERARSLAAALESAGWSVWWDRTIPTGRKFDEVIDEALREARCIVALWSEISIHKDWVLEEAEEGREKGILVPVCIENVKPPRGMRRYQAADLSGWDAQSSSPAFRQLVNDIAAIIGAPARPPSLSLDESEARRVEEEKRMAAEAEARRAQMERQAREAEQAAAEQAARDAEKAASEKAAAEAAAREAKELERGGAPDPSLRGRTLGWLTLGFFCTALGLAWGMDAPRLESAEWLKYALPALFGLLLGFAILRDWARALVVAATASLIFFFVAVPVAQKLNFIIAGALGAVLTVAAVGIWRRQFFSVGPLLRTAVAGAAGGYLFGLLDGSLWAYFAWQAIVGCVIADYGLHRSGGGDGTWNLAFKPVAAIGAASLLIGAIGLVQQNPPGGVTLYAGATQTNQRDGLPYRWIPPGEFQMGCSPGDNSCYSDEEPSHKVMITKGFWLGETEVTTAAYRKVAGTMPSAPTFLDNDLNPGWSNPRLPITKITWGEAQSYCAFVDGRLPTEAEWEYAARAGTSGVAYGNVDEIAWYANTSGDKHLDSEAVYSQSDKKNDVYGRKLSDNHNRLREVGQLPANAWGLRDMIGNLEEWVYDDYSDSLYQARASQSGSGVDDPRYSTTTAGAKKIFRGGSWYTRPRTVRASYRDANAPDERYTTSGFRCVWNNAAGSGK